MDRKIITKATALMLAFIMTFANVVLLGIYTQESIAASVNLEEQSTEVANANIEFDAYFEEEGVATHNKKIDVASNSENLCVQIKVLDGYLTNGKVQIKDSNFKLVNDDQELKSVQGIDEETNTIVLNQINKGESVVLKLPIVMNSDSNFDVENIDKISSVVLEGTYTNNNGNDASISKTIKVNAKMKANATSNIEAEVRRYVPFDVGDKKGVILQISVKSNIVDNVIPVKEEKIEIEIPKINNIDPERVSLSAKSTKASNGELERAFVENVDYTYENGKVLLTVNNEKDENNIISWEKGCEDEVLVTCIYDENAIVEETNITLKADNRIIVYDNEDTVINGNVEKNVTLNEKLGEIATYNMETKNTPISKGYMLVEGAKNTEYTEAWTVNVANKEIVDKIILDGVSGREFYADKNSNTYPAAVLYTSTKISRDNFLSMLGEDGHIYIYNEEEEIIGTLNKDNLEYIYREEITNIKIETSKPISEGILKIENKRAIKAAEYDKAQTETFNKLRVSLAARIMSGTQELFGTRLEQDISLVDPKTTIETSMSKTSLSTQEINEGIRLSVVLDTNDITNKLYKAPKVTIEFPSYIKEITNTQVELLYGQGLILNQENINQFTNTYGNKVIEMQVTGEQSAFNTSSVSNGACILMQGDIKVDELAPATSEKIKVRVLNDEENVANEIKVSYAAENKIIMRNSVLEYNDENEETSALLENNTATIEPSTETKTTKVKIDVVNSKKEEISNLVVLGRVPFAGNKTITTLEDMGSTFDANMKGRITINGGVSADDVEIYYSENQTATRNIGDAQNGWTKIPQDITKVKTYMIVFKEGTMTFGEKASFVYNIELPANLENGQKAYSTYAVYYQEGNTLKSEEAKQVGIEIEKTEVAEDPTIISSEKLDVKASITTSGKTVEENEEIKEGQYVDYTVTMKNKTQENLTFDLEIAKENGTFYGLEIYDYTLADYEPVYRYNELEDETLSENITIEAGSTYTYKYTLIANKDTQGLNLISTISFKQDNTKIEEDIIIQRPITKGLIKLNIEYNRPEYATTYSKRVFPIRIKVTNISDNTLSDIQVETDLADILTYLPESDYEEDSEHDSMEQNSNHLKYTINSLGVGQTAIIKLLADINSMPLDQDYEEIQLLAKAYVGNEEYKSNIYDRLIYQGETKITAVMTGSVAGEYVEDGQELTYTINIKNEGPLDEYQIQISDILPEGVLVEDYTIIDSDLQSTTTETNYNSLILGKYQLNKNCSMVVKIKTKINIDLAKSEIIANNATISGASFDDVITNTVTYKIKGYEEIRGTDNTKTEDDLYTISGRVWKDANSNGQRNVNEDVFSNITVMLMDNKKAELIKDNTGKELITTTEVDGTYRFENIKNGEYVVIFKYDTDNYDVTTYRAEGVSASENSDGINGTVKLGGVDTKIAMTDIIAVSGDVENIDLGLIPSKRFDLRIDKQINTVIVQNEEGTKSYTFEDGKTAKVEIPSKYMAGTNLTIEYKLRVTNEGNIAGKVIKIVDYMPKELEFSSEINNEWYQGTEGNLYTNEFENEIIQPGETKEITLVLTKRVTEAEAETINNYAEIQETYNTLGLEDMDSIADNKAQNEDDYSRADLIVTIKTGAATYTLLALGAILIIGMLGSGIYLIKKKVLTKEI